MKKSFHLIGNSEVEDWVVLRKERPDLLFAMNEIDLISATPFPLIYFNQLPLRWIQQDPGFPILLRDYVQEKLAPWIYNPHTQENQTGSFYDFVSKHDNRHHRVQVICHHQSPSESWEDITKLFPHAEIKWTSYAGAKVSWPEENRLDFRAGIYLNWMPDLIYDLSFGEGDTLSPLHIYQLQGGATLQIKKVLTNILSPQLSKTTWYGTWNLYQQN